MIQLSWVRSDWTRNDLVRNDRVRNNRVRSDQVRSDRVRNDRGLEMIVNLHEYTFFLLLNIVFKFYFENINLLRSIEDRYQLNKC